MKIVDVCSVLIIYILIFHFCVVSAHREREKPIQQTQVSKLLEEISKDGCHLSLVGFFDPVSKQHNAEILKYAFLLHQTIPRAPVTLRTSFEVSPYAMLMQRYSTVEHYKENLAKHTRFTRCRVQVVFVLDPETIADGLPSGRPDNAFAMNRICQVIYEDVLTHPSRI